MSVRRWPAEWEPQDGVLLSWPHVDARDWPDESISAAQEVYIEAIRAITRFERVVLIAPDSNAVEERLNEAGMPADRVLLVELPTNDGWIRDYGPIVVEESDGPLVFDFAFNGWGLKFPGDKNNEVTRELHEAGLFGPAPLHTTGLVLEGGSIETDGAGTLLTTARCLLSRNRNPQYGREELERQLRNYFGVQRIHWIRYGEIIGDDTGGHVDQLARLAPGDMILYASCGDPDDEHAESLARMETELKMFRTPKFEPYTLAPLPIPTAREDSLGRRIPLSYTNYLVINGAVIAPVFDDPNDDAALATLAEAFPGREIIPIDCLQLNVGGGSIHCASMNLPKGSMSFDME